MLRELDCHRDLHLIAPTHRSTTVLEFLHFRVFLGFNLVVSCTILVLFWCLDLGLMLMRFVGRELASCRCDLEERILSLRCESRI